MSAAGNGVREFFSPCFLEKPPAPPQIGAFPSPIYVPILKA